jgi:hypothetical protein
MHKAFFEELRELAAAGKRFSREEISSLQASPEYQQCGFTERAFIDILLKDEAEAPPAGGTPAPPT